MYLLIHLNKALLAPNQKLLVVGKFDDLFI